MERAEAPAAAAAAAAAAEPDVEVVEVVAAPGSAAAAEEEEEEEDEEEEDGAAAAAEEEEGEESFFAWDAVLGGGVGGSAVRQEAAGGAEEAATVAAARRLAVAEGEVRQYRGMPRCEHRPPARRGDPLEWWRGNAVQIPHLARLARGLLCIPATSASSERLFSAAGLTISARRARLTSEHAEDLLFLRGTLDKVKAFEATRGKRQQEGSGGAASKKPKA
jgi:hypothetical protein